MVFKEKSLFSKSRGVLGEKRGTNMFNLPFPVTVSLLAKLPGTTISHSSLCPELSRVNGIGQQSVNYPTNKIEPTGLSESLMLSTLSAQPG